MDLDMELNTERQGRKLGLMYQKLSKVVWVVKVEGFWKREQLVSYFSGFGVGEDGYIITCAHGNWDRWANRKITARRLDGTRGFEFDAKQIDIKTRWDLCLLQVEDKLKEDGCAKFASGKVDVGDNVLVIGHPKEFVGSCLVGNVAYACVDEIERDFDNMSTCTNFTSDALANTPLYRIMGHIYNSEYFETALAQQKKDGIKRDLSYEEKLQPQLPIIQCSGFRGGKGSSGAPIFNLNGEVVGMLVMEADGYQIGVHVTALKRFIQNAIFSKKDLQLTKAAEYVSLEGVDDLNKSSSKRRRM